MDIFSLLGFRKKHPLLLRCTHCYYELHLSPREVRLLEKQNASDTVCPVKEECHICHIGFMIPVKCTDKTGNLSACIAQADIAQAGIAQAGRLSPSFHIKIEIPKHAYIYNLWQKSKEFAINKT